MDNREKKTKAVIFDFDGVIADSVQVKTDAFKKIYNPYGKEILKKVVSHHEDNGGVSRYEKFKIYHGYLNKKLSKSGLEKLSEQFSSLVVDEVINSTYINGVLNFIDRCYKRYKLFISTGTPKSEIDLILRGKNISHYFEYVYGSPETKTSHIQKILTKYQIDPLELIFFGDSNSDIEAASAFNIPFVLVQNDQNKNLCIKYKGKIINDFNGLNL